MPVIKKQKPRGKLTLKPKRKVTKTGGSVLDRIRDVGTVERGMKINVYGLGKRGKTWFACTFPKPILILGTEDGTQTLGRMKGVRFIDIKKSSDLDKLLPVIKEEYATVVLDTAGGLQDMILKEVLGTDELPIQKSWGIAKQQDWGTCASQTKERLRALLGLADTNEKHVCIIAHERDFSKETEDTTLDVFPTVGSALTPSVAGWLNGACDYVCQCFLREQATEKQSKVGKKVITRQQRTGKIDYCLRIGPHPVFMTGFRVTPSTNLPDVLVNPTFDKLQKIIQGG